VSRIKDDYGTYYITQLGSSQRDLFQDKKDRDKFLSILLDAKEKNDFKIYAYCISRSNEYHIVINANGSDISKVMKGINISYAMYVNSHGNLYKDRYKSILIKDKDTLMNILCKIHNEGKKLNSIYNSYCLYNKTQLFESKVIDEKDIELLIAKKNCFDRNENCKDCMKTVEEAFTKLQIIVSSKDTVIDEFLKDKYARNKLIKEFRKKSTLSLKELGEVFGGLSESSICKILNSE